MEFVIMRKAGSLVGLCYAWGEGGDILVNVIFDAFRRVGYFNTTQYP